MSIAQSYEAPAYWITLYRTGDKSIVASIDLWIILDLFRGGKLSSGSGEAGGVTEGDGDTGLELGGVITRSSSE